MSNININYGRVKKSVSNIMESISDLDNIVDCDLSSLKDNIRVMTENGFRMSIVQLRECVFELSGSLLKSVNVSVNSFRENKEIIDKCTSEGFYRMLPNEFIITLSRYRNASCHRYKQPSYAELKKFYSENRKYFLYLVKDVQDRVLSN